ncbi:MAG: hypothetical protein HZB76_02435 [Chlamydiae bacterium]|nr:hypothetical protein [Chlamydiota bacterium]
MIALSFAPKSPLQYLALGVATLTGSAFEIIKHKSHLPFNISSTVEERVNTLAFPIICGALCFYALSTLTRIFFAKPGHGPGTLASFAQHDPESKRK